MGKGRIRVLYCRISKKQKNTEKHRVEMTCNWVCAKVEDDEEEGERLGIEWCQRVVLKTGLRIILK